MYDRTRITEHSFNDRIVTFVALFVSSVEVAIRAAEPFDLERLDKEFIVRGCDDPMQLETLPD